MSAIQYNSKPVTVMSIKSLICLQKGENEERDWQWNVTDQDGNVWYVVGGCDFTGWDCQSWLSWNPVKDTSTRAWDCT